MIPLTTSQGLSVKEIESLINNRDIYIWGAGPISSEVYISLKSSGLKPKAFLKTNTNFVSKEHSEIPVLHPDNVVNSFLNRNTSFIVISSVTFGKKAEQLIVENTDLRKGIDYIFFTLISRPVAIVDVSGKCNFKCLNSPVGNMRNSLPQGLMTYQTYEKVFNKLRKDLPMLTRVELSSWSDPLLNKDLSEIINLTEEYIPSAISTDLTKITYLEEIIKSQPSVLNITVNGSENSYERIMPGASWRQLTANLRVLNLLLSKYQPKTKVTLKIYAYQCDHKNDIDNIISFAKNMDFNMEIDHVYLNPYDNILAYLSNESITNESKYVINNMTWDISSAVELAKLDINLPCLSQRFFPVINWNLSVSLCHTYYYPIIAENYLEIDWEDLLLLRHQEKHCYQCQQYALHRLDLNILAKRHPNEFLQIQRRKYDRSINT